MRRNPYWDAIIDVGSGCGAQASRSTRRTVLPNSTGEDLKELGVVSLGHRRKLLDAIAALRGDASGKAPSIDATLGVTHFMSRSFG